jgi:hypothetical protein
LYHNFKTYKWVKFGTLFENAERKQKKTLLPQQECKRKTKDKTTRVASHKGLSL